MREIIISKASATYASTGVVGRHKIAALDEGSLVCFNPDNTVLDPIAPVPTGDYVQFAIGGTASRGAIVTQQIWRDGLSWEKMAYNAAVAKVMYLGGDTVAGDTAGTTLNLPAAIAVGDVYGVYVTDRSKPTWDMTRTKYYSFTAIASSTLTAKILPNIITQLIAVINADANRIVNAVVMDGGGADATGIQFTGITAGIDFAISKDDQKLKDATVSEYKILAGTWDNSYTTPPTEHERGEGSAVEIAAVEKDFSTEKGFVDGIALETLFYSHPSSVVTGETYILYVLKFKTPDSSILIREDNPIQELIIVCPDGDAVVAIMDAIMDSL